MITNSPGETSNSPAAVVQLLSEQRKTAAIAESSTGGLIGHLLTEVPGSSAVFLGGVIAYDNRLKISLGVPAEVLERDGAVSPEAARGMAEGVRGCTGADFGLAVTGIAGPGGGSAAKPVGLTYLALASEGGTVVERQGLKGDRQQIKMRAAKAALEMLTRRLKGRG